MTFPALEDALGAHEFDLAASRRQPEKLLDGGKVLQRYDYELDPLMPGEFTIGELTFSFELPPGAEEASEGAEETLHELVTEPIEIEVASPVDPESSDWALANIKPVTGIRKTKSRTLWWIAGVVLGIGVVLLLALLRKKKRRKAAIRYFKTAHELAYERLWALEDAHLIDAGKIKEYYEGVSYILRWYIEHRFDLRAPEQTTEEFLIAAGQSPELDTAQTGYLQGFLEQCDYVKFAGYAPDPGEAIKTLNSAKEFIDATSAIERRVDVTDLQEDTALHRTPVGSV